MRLIVEDGGESHRRGSAAMPAPGRSAYRTALQLRYQVYCIECNFLSPDDYPDGVETDEHDDDAAHFYAFDAHEALVGYVRLVKPDLEGRFPIQRHCHIAAASDALPPVGESAEISRLMVRSDYRRRRGDRLSGVTASQHRAAFAGGERRHEAPQVLLSLYRQMYAYCREHGIRYWYAAMERPLARSLGRLDFTFSAIGPETNYYGPVSPYVADLRELERRVGRRRPELLDWLKRAERLEKPADHVVDLGVCHISPANAVLLREDRARHLVAG